MLPALVTVDAFAHGNHTEYRYSYWGLDVVSRVGERGQITLEKAIREELGVFPGDGAVQRIEDGRVVIEFVPGRHNRSLAGSLKDRVRKQPADESWPALRRAAWEAPDPDRSA